MFYMFFKRKKSNYRLSTVFLYYLFHHAVFYSFYFLFDISYLILLTHLLTCLLSYLLFSLLVCLLACLPSVGVLNWTTNNIKQIEIKTRKNLTMTGNVYPNSDIDKLYVDKKSGGKELRSIKIMFESRLVGLRPYLTRNKNRNKIMHYIHESETDDILRVTNVLNITDNENEK